MKYLLAGFLALVLTGCQSATTPSPAPVNTPLSPQETSMNLTSTAFSNNEPIPATYTCDGDDISPPLEISGVPTATKSLALIVDDPDAPAGTWTHWLVWNIDPTITSISVGSPPSGSIEGKTSFGTTGYGGPCPPSGTHHYRFTLHALDQPLNLLTSSGVDQFISAIKNHIITSASLTGLYSR